MKYLLRDPASISGIGDRRPFRYDLDKRMETGAEVVITILSR
jgi:hypothetical protein